MVSPSRAPASRGVFFDLLTDRDLHLLAGLAEGVHHLSGSLTRGRVVTPAWKAGARGLNARRVRLRQTRL